MYFYVNNNRSSFNLLCVFPYTDFNDISTDTETLVSVNIVIIKVFPVYVVDFLAKTS